MDKLDILDRYYNTFINLEGQRDFFIGMADYLEFLDSVPEFDRITADILAEKKPLEEKLATLEKTSLEKIAKIHDDLLVYVAKKEIKSASIEEASRDYGGWLEGKIAGSSGLPDALHDQIREIVKQLYQMPDHKEFVSRYIEFTDKERGEIKSYASFGEYDEYQEVKAEIETKYDFELWGQLTEISWLYDVIKRGREKHRALVEEYQKTHSSRSAHNIFNYRILLEEWVRIERGSQRDPAFFDIKKVRPWITRLHNRILARSIGIPEATRASKILTTIENKEIPSRFKPRLIVEKDIGYLQIFKQARKHKIGGTNTRKFKLIKCLFSPENIVEALYSPALQGYERVFDAIRLPKDKGNSKLQSVATARTEMRSIIEFTIKELQKIKTLQGHLQFSWEGDKIRMDIILPEGNNNFA